MHPSAPATRTATSYLDWSDKGTATFVRYAIGLILILASWLVLGALVAVPFTLLGLTVLEGSAAGKTLGMVSSFFVAMHIANIAAFGGSWTAMLPYLVSALLYAWFAYRTGALWMAIGLHWANNLGNSVLVGTDMDVLPSLAPVIIEQPSFGLVLGLTVFSTLLTFLWLQALIRRSEGRRH